MAASDPTCTLRPGRSADIPRLRCIEHAGDQQFVAAGYLAFDGDRTITVADAEASIAAGRLFVAEDDGVVVGWIQLDRCGDEMSVHQIVVDPDCQQRGIGRALMELAFREAAAERVLVLDTQSEVVWNRPWYERLGFEVVPPASWTPAMAAVSTAQTAAGFDWSTRVHMRRRW